LRWEFLHQSVSDRGAKMDGQVNKPHRPSKKSKEKKEKKKQHTGGRIPQQFNCNSASLIFEYRAKSKGICLLESWKACQTSSEIP